MTHRLYLLRHATAEPWSPLGNDFSRSLSPAGTRHAQLVSGWVLKTLTPPDTVFCSPAKRTRETLAPILAHWPKLLSVTDYIDSMYGASLSMLMTLAEDAFSYSERLLMVGHNPAIGEILINVLQQQQAANTQQMAPGTLAIIEFSSGFKQDAHDGNLLHLIRQQNLPADSPNISPVSRPGPPIF
jgi:phosphohistidine phosphatase SixA